MRTWLFFPVVSLLLVACPDAQPGDPTGGSGGAGANNVGGGNVAGGGSGGGVADAPDFGSATTTTLVSTDEAFPNQYGWTVSVSGDTVAVGAYRDYSDLVSQGAVHVYVKSGQSFEPQTVLRAQPAVGEAFFGWAVAVSGDVVWTGAPAYSEAINLGGAAYVLTRSGESWVSQARVEEDPPRESGNFGRAVAVSGKTAVVGAPLTIDSHAFVFEENGGSWQLGGELIPDENIWDFGAAVAIDGDTLLVGSRAVEGDPRTVFVFGRAGSSWVQEDKLTPGNGGAGFGTAVSLSGDIAVVGSDEGRANRAYVFVRSGTSWSQEAELGADDGEADDAFGYSVAVSGNAVIVGAPDHDGAGNDRGAAYVFVRSVGVWSQQTKLTEAGGEDAAHFGISVAIDGKVAVVGGVSETTDTGSATIYLAE